MIPSAYYRLPTTGKLETVVLKDVNTGAITAPPNVAEELQLHCPLARTPTANPPTSPPGIRTCA